MSNDFYTKEIDIPNEEYENEQKGSSKNFIALMVVVVILGFLVGATLTFILSYNKIYDNTWQQYIDNGYIQTKFTTATSKDIMAGKTAYVDGQLITGTYVPIDENSTDATSGDILKGFKGYVGTTLVEGNISTYDGERYYVPGTKDIKIKGKQYVADFITIRGDADLISENIKKGVKIFGVEGSYE